MYIKVDEFILYFLLKNFCIPEKMTTFASQLRNQVAQIKMVDVVQLVRASDCGSECRRFEPDRPPLEKPWKKFQGFFRVGGCGTKGGSESCL